MPKRTYKYYRNIEPVYFYNMEFRDWSGPLAVPTVQYEMYDRDFDLLNSWIPTLSKN